MSLVNKEFKSGLTNPFYFIRNGLYRAINKHSNSLSGHLMDFGCGSKPYRNIFNVRDYVGVDFKNEGHPHDNESIDVFYDGKHLPFPDESFDSVLSSEVFEHIFNLPEMLVEINRVMKHGGRILITCPFVWNEHEKPFDYARYTEFALKDLFERSGFRVIAFEKSGNFITTTFQIWVLYWHTVLSKAARRNVLVRTLLKYFLIFPLNVSGLIADFLLPRNDSLYLSNVLVAEKVNSDDKFR